MRCGVVLNFLLVENTNYKRLLSIFIFVKICVFQFNITDWGEIYLIHWRDEILILIRLSRVWKLNNLEDWSIKAFIAIVTLRLAHSVVKSVLDFRGIEGQISLE